MASQDHHGRCHARPRSGHAEHRHARRTRGDQRPLAAVAATAGLPVTGVVLAGLAGVTAIIALAAALEFLTTRVDRVAELFRTFPSPIVLPLWLTITLAVGGALAGVERALTLRRNRVLDIETMWTNL